ncbi:MAG: hypothetical protein HYZ53_04355 [Planctomycetes bacterium]|nr:hypothetical protein [Planctomycetota bacterium]
MSEAGPFIAALKKRFVEAKKLSDVQDYFLNHLETELLGRGKTVTHPELMETVRYACRQVLDRKFHLGETLLKRMEESSFLYGSFILDGLPASIFYFEDIRAGMLAFVNPSTPGRTEYVRFRTEVAIRRPPGPDAGGAPPTAAGSPP